MKDTHFLGLTYNHADLFLTFRRVADYFGLKRYGILGHSMGGGVALPYTTLHPKEVVALIMLDVLRLRYRTPEVGVSQHKDSSYPSSYRLFFPL